MKDALDRDLVIGNTVVYANSKGLKVVTITNFEKGKVTIDDAGTSRTVKFDSNKFLLYTV